MSVSVKKINPHLFPSFCLFFLIVILSQVPTFLCADDKQYTNCTQLFQCANIPNVSYPFWGGNRPDYCGRPSFELNCQGDAPLITIQTRPHRVLVIDNTAQILTAVRAEFWNNSCPAELHNTTLDTAHFNYSSNTQDLMPYLMQLLRIYSSNSTSGSFVCYCSDQPYAITCRTGSSTFSFGQGIKLTIVIVALAVIFLIRIIFYHKRRFTSSVNVVGLWKKETVDDQNVKAFMKNHGSLAPKRYRCSDLTKMTSSFKDKLGQGRYGSVYKGKLSDGRQ